MTTKKISVLEQFHEFCTRGVDEEVAKILKDSKSSINTPGQLGNTALHWASSDSSGYFHVLDNRRAHQSCSDADRCKGERECSKQSQGYAAA